jgi:hypothetical protein
MIFCAGERKRCFFPHLSATIDDLDFQLNAGRVCFRARPEWLKENASNSRILLYAPVVCPAANLKFGLLHMLAEYRPATIMISSVTTHPHHHHHHHQYRRITHDLTTRLEKPHTRRRGVIWQSADDTLAVTEILTSPNSALQPSHLQLERTGCDMYRAIHADQL